MISPTIHDQRKTHSRTRGTSLRRGSCAPFSAHDEHKPSDGRTLQSGFPLCLTHSLCTTGAWLHCSAHFPIRTAGGRCICEQRRRALRLLPGRLATHSTVAVHGGPQRRIVVPLRQSAVPLRRDRFRSRLQFAPVIGQLCQDHAQSPECHLERPSYRSVADNKQPSERGKGRVPIHSGKIPNSRGALPNVGG